MDWNVMWCCFRLFDDGWGDTPIFWRNLEVEICGSSSKMQIEVTPWFNPLSSHEPGRISKGESGNWTLVDFHARQHFRRRGADSGADRSSLRTFFKGVVWFFGHVGPEQVGKEQNTGSLQCLAFPSWILTCNHSSYMESCLVKLNICHPVATYATLRPIKKRYCSDYLSSGGAKLCEYHIHIIRGCWVVWVMRGTIFIHCWHPDSTLATP